MPPSRPALPSARTGSRWAKSDVTYGPFGRIVATILLIVPTLWFISIATLGISLGGLVVWGGVIMPMGLRHVWARVPVQRE